MHAKKILISYIDHLIHPTVPTPDPDSLAISPCRTPLLHPSLAQVPVKLLVDLGDENCTHKSSPIDLGLGRKKLFQIVPK